MPLLKTERGSPEGSDEVDSDDRNTSMVCLVCGDVATGRHYGALACNGCKGFFRRTIRRAYKYTCRFSGNCNIDKHNRAVCRACRFSRCIRFGMKMDAVQNERDLIGKRPRTHSTTSVGPASVGPTGTISPPVVSAAASLSPVGVALNGASGPSGGHFFAPETPVDSEPTVLPPMRGPKRPSGSGNSAGDPWDCPQKLLDLLMKAEEKIKNLRASVIKETGKVDYTHRHEPPKLNQNGRKATPNDILHSLHSQLLLVIEWAKTLKPFAELCTEDQTALLKNFASQHIVLCVAYRSKDAPDFLHLLNDTCIPRVNAGGADEGDDFYRKDCERVLDQLVAPMRFLGINDFEFVAMKACVLFNPVARGLSNESVMKVLDTRRRIFSALEHYVRTKQPYDQCRVGDLTFFILSPLQGLAKSISEDVLLSKLSGIAELDTLMEELMLEDTEPKHHKHAIDLRRSLSETEPPMRRTTGGSCAGEMLAEMRPMPVPATTASSLPLPASAPAQFDIGQQMMNPAANGEMSPNNWDMTSTLSSYVFGGPLQGPISPTNDVMFSTTTAPTPPTQYTPMAKLSSCSSQMGGPDVTSPSAQQPQWTTAVPSGPFEAAYPAYTNSVQPVAVYPTVPTAVPLNYGWPPKEEGNVECSLVSN
ncbi:hypothetical protein M3Y99_01907500 [Aphelenchoides fujianensis]|nr:hypothetical protein M3Y99_01907500 [Aphelenchoides fujianensis]